MPLTNWGPSRTWVRSVPKCSLCQDSLLKFSSKGLDLGLELEVIDKEQEVGNGEEEEAKDKGHK